MGLLCLQGIDLFLQAMDLSIYALHVLFVSSLVVELLSDQLLLQALEFEGILEGYLLAHNILQLLHGLLDGIYDKIWGPSFMLHL